MDGAKKSPTSPTAARSEGGKYADTEELAVFPGAFSPRKAAAFDYIRPHTACYMRPMTTYTADRQITRTPEALVSSRRHKTERYRENGTTRWPPLAENNEISMPNQFKRTEETLPLRRAVPNQDTNGPAELWRRALRTPGVPIADEVYGSIAGTVQGLHQEWSKAPRSPMGEKPLAYTGRTCGSRMATPRMKNIQDWVLRPVSTGQFALEHHDGKRYAFTMSPKTVPVQVGTCRSKGAVR